MSAPVPFPQVRCVSLLGSSPTRPTERPQAESFWPGDTQLPRPAGRWADCPGPGFRRRGAGAVPFRPESPWPDAVFVGPRGRTLAYRRRFRRGSRPARPQWVISVRLPLSPAPVLALRAAWAAEAERFPWQRQAPPYGRGDAWCAQRTTSPRAAGERPVGQYACMCTRVASASSSRSSGSRSTRPRSGGCPPRSGQTPAQRTPFSLCGSARPRCPKSSVGDGRSWCLVRRGLSGRRYSATPTALPRRSRRRAVRCPPADLICTAPLISVAISGTVTFSTEAPNTANRRGGRADRQFTGSPRRRETPPRGPSRQGPPVPPRGPAGPLFMPWV